MRIPCKSIAPAVGIRLPFPAAPAQRPASIDLRPPVAIATPLCSSLVARNWSARAEPCGRPFPVIRHHPPVASLLVMSRCHGWVPPGRPLWLLCPLPQFGVALAHAELSAGVSAGRRLLRVRLRATRAWALVLTGFPSLACHSLTDVSTRLGSMMPRRRPPAAGASAALLALAWR